MTRLAELEDLAAYTGETADPTDRKALDALDAASALVRAYIDRDLDYQEDEEVILAGTGTSTLPLPEYPVAEVSEVAIITYGTDDEEVLETTDYRLQGRTLHRIDGYWHPNYGVRVVYTHGYTLPGEVNPTLPPEIRAVTARIASRGYQRASDDGREVTQRSLGSYSESFSTSTATTTAVWSLEDEEMAILAPHRRVGL